MQQSEVDKIAALKKQGYTVEVCNPNATSFDSKYHVYKKTSIGNKTAVVDKDGNVSGMQG